MVYGMAGGHDKVFDMVCRTWHGIGYCLESMTGCVVLPGRHGMVYGIAWRGMGWYMVWPGRMTYIWYCLFVCVEFLRPSQQLSCRAGQLLINTVPGQALRPTERLTST